MNRIVKVLMDRDGLSEEEAKELFKSTAAMIAEALEDGMDPDEVLMDELGLEPDYMDDILL